MRKIDTSLVLSIAALMLSGCAYHPMAIPHETALEDVRYTRYTWRGERAGFKTNVFRSNYLDDEVAFPAGSQVEFKLFSERRIDLDVDGIPCELFSPYAPFPITAEEIDAFLDKHFVQSKGEIRLAELDSATRESIEKGVATVGMSKEEVLLALGYPTKIGNDVDAAPLSDEEVLHSNQWIYRTKHILWVSHWRIYQFDLEGSLIRIIE